MPGSAAAFLPPLYDIVWSAVPLVLLAVVVAGLISIFRRRRVMSGPQSLGWTAFVVFAPMLGTLAWFAIGRNRYSTLPGVD